jgi:uncharacterized protein (DUF58 family)
MTSSLNGRPAAPSSPATIGLPPEVLRRVRQIEIRSRRLVNQFFAGEYHAVFRGRGLEFVDVRAYEPGDEIRSIDWNVTARMGEPYVKRFIEERELTVLLAVDLSASQGFGSGGQSKRDVAAEIAAVIALAAVRNNDKIGLIAFTDRIETVVPAGKGLRHALRIVRELLFRQPAGRGTDIAGAIRYASTLLHRRSIVFLVSDFVDEGYAPVLRVAGRRHDITAVIARDPREDQIPNVGLIEVEDAETGDFVLIDTGDRRVRARYAARAAALREERQRALKGAQIDWVEVSTTEPYAAPLIAYFKRRAATAAVGGVHRAARTVGRRA